jgi:hypothetical protein
MNRRDALRSIAILPAIAAGCAASHLVGYVLDGKTGVKPVLELDQLLAEVEELTNGLERELWDRFPQVSCWRVETTQDKRRQLVIVSITGFLSTGDEFRSSFAIWHVGDMENVRRLFRGHKWHVMVDIGNKIHGSPLA